MSITVMTPGEIRQFMTDLPKVSLREFLQHDDGRPCGLPFLVLHVATRLVDVDVRAYDPPVRGRKRLRSGDMKPTVTAFVIFGMEVGEGRAITITLPSEGASFANLVKRVGWYAARANVHVEWTQFAWLVARGPHVSVCHRGRAW